VRFIVTAFVYSEASPEAGAFVALVGPSGVGKDTVLALLRAQTGSNDRFVFPKRIITRPSDSSEDLIEIDKYTFETQKGAGAFALSWSAHGLDYAIPLFVEDAISAGKIVVVNVSRAVIGQVRTRFGKTCVVLLSAPLQARAQRIAMRGREDESVIRDRLARTVDTFTESDADLIIDNSGSPEVAARMLLGFLLSIRSESQA
jgi:ribose 1,5-bisphosphokinase